MRYATRFDSAPAIVIQADKFDLLRCRCPICLMLDAQHPNEGFQMALFPYRSPRAKGGRGI